MTQKRQFGLSVSTVLLVAVKMLKVSPPLTTHLDNPQDLVGAPIGLQMIGRKLEEEKVLKLVGVAVNALGSTK